MSFVSSYLRGTFGMIKDTDGSLKTSTGHLGTLLKSIPEFSHSDMPTYELIEWNPPLDSSDFSPDEWVRLAKTISENYYKYDGFVILHGTDTMAYTASALSFMFENLSKPVIITGAQVPLMEVYNDAKRNLIVSMLLASNFDVPEVCIFFNLKLFRGNRTKKIDNWGIDAFGSPNFPPLATMGTAVNFRTELVLEAPKRRFRCFTNLNTNIYVLHMIPGFDDSSLNVVAEKDPTGKRKALVISLYGTGNAPSRKPTFVEFLNKAISNDIVIVIVTQCLRGSVNLSSYAAGIHLKKLGLIDGSDMTIEACVTKLAYLMGLGLQGEEFVNAMNNNLRGELTKDFNKKYVHNASPINKLLSNL